VQRRKSEPGRGHLLTGSIFGQLQVADTSREGFSALSLKRSAAKRFFAIFYRLAWIKNESKCRQGVQEKRENSKSNSELVDPVRMMSERSIPLFISLASGFLVNENLAGSNPREMPGES